MKVTSDIHLVLDIWARYKLLRVRTSRYVCVLHSGMCEVVITMLVAADYANTDSSLAVWPCPLIYSSPMECGNTGR